MKELFIDTDGRTWLGEGSGAPEAPLKPRSGKIVSPQQLDALAPTIGEQNVLAGKRALADGAQVWVFLSLADLEADPELTEPEKEVCRKIFQEEELGYAGYYRTPSMPDPTVKALLTSSRGAIDVYVGRSGNWSH